jgi:starch-binding outer membrane protein, SusD/RagB family
MKNFLKISIVFLCTFLITSCEDYVDVEPLQTLDAENFFKSKSDYDRALIGGYDLLQTSYLTLWLGEIASDNSIAGGESVTDSEGLHQIDNMTHGGQNSELRSLWRFMYSGITRVNYLFENKSKLEFEGKEELYGEAHFLRAYYYSELVKVFGDIPLIIDHRLASSDAATTERTPASEVYAQVETDLLAAISVLDWNPSETGRITKGAALALLGKVYLYQNKFSEAAGALDQVINEGPYDLFADFNTLFLLANEDSEESVFDIQYVGSEGGGYGCFVCLEGFVAVGFHGIRGYEGPTYGDGNSYNLPTQDLVDAFGNDPRLDASVLDIEALKNTDLGNIKYTTGAGGHTGYYNNKYIKRKNELGPPDDDLTSPLNHHVIRFADVLLMAAEAHNRKASPDDEQARVYLNRVRDRVDLGPVALSGSALTEAIWNERRLELAGEGQRFFDLVRTGKAAQEIEGFIVGTHEVFPIPQDEIDLTGAGWEQNNGY